MAPDDQAEPRWPSAALAARRGNGAKALERLLVEVRACRICAAHLPLGPRPIVQAHATARVLIAGQAPARNVHESGIPWHDRTGDRLRGWLGIDRATFYDARRVALVPQGFCYPGRGRSGDLPPRRECAETWHPRLLALLPRLELVVAVGTYAQAYYLGAARKPTLGETVRGWRGYLPRRLPLPHPSWHNNRWLKENPWFERETLRYARAAVRRLVAGAVL